MKIRKIATICMSIILATAMFTSCGNKADESSSKSEINVSEVSITKDATSTIEEDSSEADESEVDPDTMEVPEVPDFITKNASEEFINKYKEYTESNSNTFCNDFSCKSIEKNIGYFKIVKNGKSKNYNINNISLKKILEDNDLSLINGVRGFYVDGAGYEAIVADDGDNVKNKETSGLSIQIANTKNAESKDCDYTISDNDLEELNKKINDENNLIKNNDVSEIPMLKGLNYGNDKCYDPNDLNLRNYGSSDTKYTENSDFTVEFYGGIKLGMTRDEVKKILGDTSKNDEKNNDSKVIQDNFYFNEKTKAVMNFVYVNDELVNVQLLNANLYDVEQ